MPERETTPIGPGVQICPGMMPTLAMPGVMIPGQLGPINRTPRSTRYGKTRVMSRTGTPSLMHTTSLMPASAASKTASAANLAGT